MIISWVLFPLVLVAVCLGCGMAVERAAGTRLPGTLTLSLGLVLVIVAATFTTHWEATAPLTTWLVVALAIAGYATSLGRLRKMRPEPWALAVGLGVYAVCAAPIVLSGNATFLGYFLLNDTAVHFDLINQLMAHGHTFAGVPPSTLKGVLQAYLSTSYPIGSQIGVGAVQPLVGQNIAWIFQPYLAAILSFGALALYQLLDGLTSSRPLRALAAFVAAQAGLVYAYYLEASIKELATTWVLTLIVVLVVLTLRERLRLRRLLPLALASVAAFDILDLAIVPWIGVALAVFVVVAAWRSRRVPITIPRRRLALGSVGATAVVAVIAVPVISGAETFFKVASGVLTQKGDLGNLAAPLIKWQMLGIWPSGDFRFPVITHYRVTYALLGVAIASAALGTLWAIRKRAFMPLLLLASSGAAAAYLLSIGSPYASAKVMMIFSLTVVLIEMLGPIALHDSGRRIEAWGLAFVLAGGVLWTNALAYHDASVAPRARLAELASIDSRFAGQGPAFYNLGDEFGVPFLRKLAPFDTVYGPPTVRPGLPPREPSQLRDPYDPDELAQSFVQSFHLLVLGRSPRTSRPPSDFKLAYRGAYYDVWKRTASPQVLQHIPLGSGLQPASVPRCKMVLRLGRRAAREHARLAYVQRSHVPTLVPTQATRPDNWGEVGGDPYSLIPRQEPGAVTGTLYVARAGTYSLWIEGAFSERVEVSIDNHLVGSDAYQLGPPEQTVPIGSATLSAGVHHVSITVPMNGLAPGVGVVTQTIGPLMLAPADEALPVSEVPPARAHSLCGRNLDWIEIVRPVSHAS